MIHSGLCTTVDGPDPGKPCIFPFIHKHQKRTTCAWAPNGNFDWCPTKLYLNGSTMLNDGKWGVCGPQCPNRMTKRMYKYMRGKPECKKMSIQVLTQVHKVPPLHSLQLINQKMLNLTIYLRVSTALLTSIYGIYSALNYPLKETLLL